MRTMLYLALLALLALFAGACGDAGDTMTDTLDAALDLGKGDATPAKTDLPVSPDSSVAPDLPMIPADAPAFLDVPALIDAPTTPIDAPTTPIDAPTTPIDAPTTPIDGRQDPSDAEIRTLRSPDGRTWTIVMVDSCYTGPGPSSQCPATYAEARAKLASSLDAGLPFNFGTGIGQCSEGSYLYAPFWGLETLFCFYDASTQKLAGSRQSSDVTHECGTDGTASNSWSQGNVPPCTNITWEIKKLPYN